MGMDKYQRFGVFTLIISLLLLIVLPPWDKVIFLAGIPYSVVFLFHAKIRRLLLPRIDRPLLLFQDALDEEYRNRVTHWSKLPIAFAVQIIPMLVLLASAMIVNLVLGD